MKVSIVTITYNRAHLIGDTIQSVLDQTYQNFEHIIIDDGSTDDTKQIVTNFGDERIKYFKYEKNKKRSFLRNEGVRKSSGELISFLDSDDIWTVDKLSVVTNVFKENIDVEFVIHNLSFLPENKDLRVPFSNYSTDFYRFILDDLLFNSILPFPIFTIKSTTFFSLGLLDENCIDGQHDLYLRIAANFKVYYCVRKLTYMKKHDGNISSKADVTHYKDYIKSLKKLILLKKISKKHYLNLMIKINLILTKHYIKRFKLIFIKSKN